MGEQTGDPPQELAAQLADAVEEFRSAVARQALDLMAAAEERATQRERDAGKAARRIEQDAERKAERILQAALERASVVLESIDALEGALTGTMKGLRSEADRLTTDLTAQTDQAAVRSDDQVASAEAASGIERQLALVPTGQLRQVVRAAVHKMRDEGRPRADAERFLIRFRLDEAHGDAIDEIYGPSANRSARPAWGRWRHRRRAE